MVIPCYNEEEVLPETANKLLTKLHNLIEKHCVSDASRILFVNDGSHDNTWELITNLYNQNPLFSGLNLSRNRGHQNALLAGLMFAKDHADMVISMDADLQDDIDAIDEMITKYKNGIDIVYGVRSSRKKDSFFKRVTAEAFYRFMNFLGADVVFNHADYRLMSKRALAALTQFKEVNLFLRGLVPLLGFSYDTVEYERGKRFAGKSKYPLSKMLNFALDGITSLSIRPLRLIAGLGIGIFSISILMIIYNIFQWICGNTITGWASLSCSLWFLGGLIIFSMGIVGEYIGKIYLETKQRPRFIIKDILTDDHDKID